MELKKSNIPNNTITRKLTDLDAKTGNIYESVVIISKRANQVASEIKQELNRKLADFSSASDSLEETFENREQIEISKYYEKLPKPAIIARSSSLARCIIVRVMQKLKRNKNLFEIEIIPAVCLQERE